MRRLAVLTFVLGLMIGVLAIRALATSSSQVALASDNCSTKTLSGSYSLQVWDKFINSSIGTPIVTAYIVEGGLMTFDGTGGVTFVHEGSFNGTSQFGPENRSGIYSVQPNCMGSFTMQYQASPPSPTCCTNHYDFVIVAKGSELTIFQRDIGTVSAGTAIKQGVIDS